MLYANAFEARVDAALKVRLGEQERFLREFEANAVGQFSGVPEPATLILLCGAAGPMLLRRRRRRS